LIPITIGVSILRYRLLDIDIVINRALLFGALAIFITAVYVSIVVGVGALVGRRANPVLSAAAAAVVALAFQPARRRAQRLADRLVYGKRATPYEVLSEFSERLGKAYANDELLPRMALALAEAPVPLGPTFGCASATISGRRLAGQRTRSRPHRSPSPRTPRHWRRCRRCSSPSAITERSLARCRSARSLGTP
ncbi:MAG TPA: hypothetical protein VEQ37_13195, partial [Actinomycetota bacterium]|nr:hypothetical protein [Actinomycetota bacterium]